MSNLTDLRGRVALKLQDLTQVIWSADTLDEAIKSALDEYSLTLPVTADDVLTFAADGREIDISSLAGLQKVTSVHWPYADPERPPNRVRGFYVYSNAGVLTLELNYIDGGEPVTGDEIRVWYSVRQAIEDLDGADATTVPAVHESLIVLGAAAHAANTRAVDLLRVTEIDPGLVAKYESWGAARLKEFRASLELLRGEAARCGSSWGAGWELDKWA